MAVALLHGLLWIEETMAVVVNKNTSEIYSEVVDFNPHIWEEAQERATRIITSDRSLMVCMNVIGD